MNTIEFLGCKYVFFNLFVRAVFTAEQYRCKAQQNGRFGKSFKHRLFSGSGRRDFVVCLLILQANGNEGYVSLRPAFRPFLYRRDYVRFNRLSKGLVIGHVAFWQRKLGRRRAV